MGKLETVRDFLFWGSKIIADGDCNHEIKRPLLLGRKVMTNLDSILKSRDITFANKGLSSQGCGFSCDHVWCESWTVKKAECQNIDALGTMVLEKTLESPLDCKVIQLVHPKGISPGCSLEGLMLKLKLQYFGHLMWRIDSLDKTLMLGGIRGQKDKGWTEDEMAGWHHQLNRHEFE